MNTQTTISISASPEKLQILERALSSLVELLGNSTSADRDADPAKADADIVLAKEMIRDVEAEVARLASTREDGPECPNCGSPVDGHPEDGCILAAMIQCLADRGEIPEEDLLLIHANANTDLLWADLGPILDKLGNGIYE